MPKFLYTFLVSILICFSAISQEDTNWYPYQNSIGKWSFKSVDGKLFNETYFDSVIGIHQGRGIVKKEGGWGVIDSSGKIIIPYSFLKINVINLNYEVYSSFFKVLRRNNENKIETSIFNSSGEIIVPFDVQTVKLFDVRKYASVDEYQHILGHPTFACYLDYFYLNKVYSLNGKVVLEAIDLKENPKSYFFINDKGIVVTIPKKFSTDFFKYDLIRRSNKSERVIIRKRDTYMMLDYAGNIIVPFDKYKIDILSRDSPHFSFQDSTSKWGLLDRYGKIVVETQFNKRLENYPEFNVKIGYDSINSVIFDSSLNSISYPYEEIIPISRKMNKNVYRVKKDGRWGVLHGTKEIIPPQCGGVIIIESLGLFICTKEGEISVFNLQGELILNSDMISVKYDKLSFLLIEKKRKYQYYDLRYKDPTEHVRKVKKAKLHEDWNSTLIPSLVSKEPYIVRIYTKRKGFMFVDSLGEPMMSNYANCGFIDPVIFNGKLIGYKCINPDFDFNQSFTDSRQNVERKVRLYLFNGVVIDDNYPTISFNPENEYFLALKDNYYVIYSVQGERLMSFLLDNNTGNYDSRFFNELAKKDNEYTQRVKETLEKTGVNVSRLDDIYILESNKGKKIILNLDKETISSLYDKIEIRPHHLICTYSESKSSDILDRNGKLLYSKVTINNGPGFSFNQNGIRYWMTINGEIYAKTEIKF